LVRASARASAQLGPGASNNMAASRAATHRGKEYRAEDDMVS
jgi:hypothetical protein